MIVSRWCGLFLVLLAAGAGCGGNALPTYPVKGKVQIDGGGALKVGEVIFSSDKVTARGQLQEDGTFVLSTFKEGGGDGAPPGNYEVAILGAVVSKKDDKNPYASEPLIDPKYGDRATSGLKFTVESKPNQFEITVKKPEQK